ncbi:hypothetical protein KKA17_03040 [bacterium]|nr:hypothetical protein [bacterium]MBU1884853.1 hypothetical protein [bacterium]
MNRINPIYILLLLVILFSFFYFKSVNAKEELSATKDEYKEILKMANELSSLKNIYDNKAVQKASLQRILKSSKIDVIQQEKKDSILLRVDNMDYSSLNILMDRVLNGSFNITTLEIKKISDENANLQMEIKW